MKIIPSRLVTPTPASGVASIIRSIKDVNLDPGLALSIKGEDVGLNKEVDLDECQYLVVRFWDASSTAPCNYHCLLVKFDPDEINPVVVGDSRVPALYEDALDYRRRLAHWRPGIKELAKAENDVEYSFALRIAMELSTAKPKPQTPPPEDDFA